MSYKPENKNKWDSLYDPEKKTFFANLEEKAINWYFAGAFRKVILSVSGIKSGKIFEPGCGSGMTCAQFAKAGYDITLMDLSFNALQKAISVFEKISVQCKFTLGDLFHMPIQDGQFDIVFNQGVMEHFKLAGLDPSEGIKEMLRVLKRNGTLVILVPAYFSPLFFVHRIFRLFNLIDKYWPYEDQEFLHKRELYEMMRKGGCKNIVVRRVWPSFFFSMIGYCKKD